jgi:TolA-binding protein
MKKTYIILLIGIILAGCGKKDPQEYMEQAKAGVAANNIAEAVSSYQKLVKEYPDSPQASEALFQLGTLYQNKMVTNIEAKASLEKAVDIFKSISDKYPQSKLAPKSLFMSGFILANDLKEYNKATVIFNIFLKKYPNSDLVNSAKEELDNMGLSPEEILKNKS